MLKKTAFTCLSLYLLLAGLTATVPSLLVPTSLMAALALTASLTLFIDTWS